jgi:hypothetical protein
MSTTFSPQTMRLILLVVLFGMQLLAAFYLRQRRMPFLAFLSWGLLALLLPVLGPYLVIASKPGKRAGPLRRYPFLLKLA